MKRHRHPLAESSFHVAVAGTNVSPGNEMFDSRSGGIGCSSIDLSEMLKRDQRLVGSATVSGQAANECVSFGRFLAVPNDFNESNRLIDFICCQVCGLAGSQETC